MSLARMQTFDEEPKTSEVWSIRKILSSSAVAVRAVVEKVFVHIEDFLLVYLTLVMGISELLGKVLSWRLYALILVLLAINFVRRFYPLHAADERTDAGDPGK